MTLGARAIGLRVGSVALGVTMLASPRLARAQTATPGPDGFSTPKVVDAPPADKAVDKPVDKAEEPPRPPVAAPAPDRKSVV